jgi:hypothetical protein
VTGLLKSNLKEEKAADRKLNTLAEGKVNRSATGRRTAAARRGLAIKVSRKPAAQGSGGKA